MSARSDHNTTDGTTTRNRRRSGPETDEAILEATLEMLDDVGLDRLTVEGVAKRAGVAKTTIYRRWDDKYMLAAAALDRARPVLQFPDTGSLRGDLRMLFRTVEHALGNQRLRQTFAILVHALLGDQRFHAAYWTAFVEPRRAQVAEVLTRAQHRGELPADADTDLLIDVIAGSGLYQVLRPAQEPITDRMDRVVTLLTGSPPTDTTARP